MADGSVSTTSVLYNITTYPGNSGLDGVVSLAYNQTCRDTDTCFYQSEMSSCDNTVIGGDSTQGGGSCYSYGRTVSPTVPLNIIGMDLVNAATSSVVFVDRGRARVGFLQAPTVAFRNSSTPPTLTWVLSAWMSGGAGIGTGGQPRYIAYHGASGNI